MVCCQISSICNTLDKHTYCTVASNFIPELIIPINNNAKCLTSGFKFNILYSQVQSSISEWIWSFFIYKKYFLIACTLPWKPAGFAVGVSEIFNINYANSQIWFQDIPIRHFSSAIEECLIVEYFLRRERTKAVEFRAFHLYFWRPFIEFIDIFFQTLLSNNFMSLKLFCEALLVHSEREISNFPFEEKQT